MRWIAALCIVLAIESGVDVLSMPGSAQRRQSVQRTTSKADLQARLSVAAQYREQGDYDRAAQEYLKLIQLAPRFAPAYNELGVCYMRQGKLADAARALGVQNYLELFPPEFTLRLKMRAEHIAMPQNQPGAVVPVDLNS